MTARPQETRSRASHEIAIVGSDMLLAALPARPIQLSHALLASGFSLVVPASWGDELLAEHAVRQVLSVDARPRIYCACPRIRHRLLAAGDELAPHLLALIPPPVAAARYLRNAWPAEPLHIVYIGGCEGADDPSIDERVTPAEMLARLDARGIIPARLPTTFRDVVPPDRRRYWSLPGGCPSPEALAEHAGDRQLRPIGRDGYTQELVEGLLSGQPLLLDLGETFGCACAGRVEVHGVAATRQEVVALEPPRAPLPVLDPDIVVDVDYRPRLVLSRATTARPPEPPDLVAPASPDTPPLPPTAAAPPPAPAFEPPPDDSNYTQPVAWPPATVPSARTLRRSMAVTPPGVAVTASREGRQPPPQQILGGERQDSRTAVTAPRTESLTPAHGLHRVARTRASLRVTREHGAAVPRAFAALRRSGANPAIDAATVPPPAAADATPPVDIEGAPAPIEAATQAAVSLETGAAMQEQEPPQGEPEHLAPAQVEEAAPGPANAVLPHASEARDEVRPVEEEPVEAAPVHALVTPPVADADATAADPAQSVQPPPVEPLSAAVQSPVTTGHAERVRPPRLTPIPPPPPPQPRRLRGLLATAALLLAIIALVVAVFGL